MNRNNKGNKNVIKNQNKNKLEEKIRKLKSFAHGKSQIYNPKIILNIG